MWEEGTMSKSSKTNALVRVGAASILSATLLLTGCAGSPRPSATVPVATEAEPAVVESPPPANSQAPVEEPEPTPKVESPPPADSQAPVEEPEPTPSKPALHDSIEYNLALLDDKGSTADDSPKILRFRYLLDAIRAATGERDIRIADMTVAGQKALLDQYGREASLLTIMEATRKSAVTAPGVSCARVVTNVIVDLGTK
jgi:type IV secretory pathway VirB10-like protein